MAQHPVRRRSPHPSTTPPPLAPSKGHLDLLTDEAFLEAIQSFFASIPTADVWQDQAWQEQQRRLLAAQFGPREVESLAVNAVVPALEEENGADAALDWVIAKETQDLAVLHGQSDLSSWYFVEHGERGWGSEGANVWEMFVARAWEGFLWLPPVASPVDGVPPLHLPPGVHHTPGSSDLVLGFLVPCSTLFPANPSSFRPSPSPIPTSSTPNHHPHPSNHHPVPQPRLGAC